MENPADRKNCGSYVFGALVNGKRNKDSVLSRSAVTLDVDSPRADFLARLHEVMAGRAYAWHTTWRTTAETPRYRVIIPLAIELSAKDYRAAAGEIMRQVSPEGREFDPSSDEPERLMLKPSAQPEHRDAYDHKVRAGDWMDATLYAEVAGPPATLPDANPRATAGGNPVDGKAYFLRAADDEADLLAFHYEGDRNSGLNRAAFKLGQVAHLWPEGAEEDAEDSAREKLLWACTENDFIKWGDETEFHRAFGNGWRDGLDNPRDVKAADPLEQDGIAAGGWEPVDLTPFLDGSYVPLVPTVMTRTDGQSLLYAGRTHSIHGESESGKSMVVQAVAAALLTEGQRVLYLDYEDEPGSVTERLTLMGVAPDMIRANFTYTQPATDHDSSPESRAAFERLLGQRYALAVVDGVTEALTQAPTNQRSTGGLGGNDDVANWHNRLPRRIAQRTGAAVVQIDHVAKSAELTRFALGGQAKMASLTGAAYHVKPVESLGRGRVGTIEIHVAKDRPGFVRGRAEGAFDPAVRMQLVAVAVVDGTGGRITMHLNPPVAQPTRGADSELMERISHYLEGLPATHEGASRTLVNTEVKGRRERVYAALDALVAGGFVSRRLTTDKSQTSYHLSVHPYTDFEEAL